MHDDESLKNGIRRRAVLRRAALFALASCGLGLAARAGEAADEKMSQKDAEYQPKPKNGQSCAICQYFQPPSACKLVKGKISPQGWCSFFGHKT